MHRAALQGLGLVGDKLKSRDEAPRHHEGTRKSRSPNKYKSHTVTIVLGTEAEVENHDLHHQGATTVHDTKEADDPNLQGTHTITRTTKKR
jgi:hypothetical protein